MSIAYKHKIYSIYSISLLIQIYNITSVILNVFYINMLLKSLKKIKLYLKKFIKKCKSKEKSK